MPQSERWQRLGREILSVSRTELYLSLPFLDSALAALPPAGEGDTPTLATDARRLYYNGAWLAQQYERGRANVCRAYLHVVLHCLLRHPAKKRGREGELWDLACDIAVEQLLDGLEQPCLDRPRALAKRRVWYDRLSSGQPALTAEAIYRALRREHLPVFEQAALAREFWVDDHSLWETAPEEQENETWRRIAERTQTGLETVHASEALGGQAIAEQLRVENRPPDDYRAFLRRFTVLGETLRVDDDSFDYGYYTYGLRHYGNLPLIEPLETSEVRRIAELVVAIDTSMSTAGETVRGFLAATWQMLRTAETFFRRFTLRILQCDDQLRDDRVIHTAEELSAYMEHLTLIGQSATDFRPVFDHIAALQAAGELRRLRGLLYFTDGLGIYPARRPPYDTAFIMLAGQGHPDHVPPWGIRVVLDEDGLQGEDYGYQTSQTGN